MGVMGRVGRDFSPAKRGMAEAGAGNCKLEISDFKVTRLEAVVRDGSMPSLPHTGMGADADPRKGEWE